MSASTTSVLTGSRSASQHLPYINGVGLAGTFAWNDFSATAWRYADHGNYVVYRQNSLDGAGYKFIHRQTESAGLRDFIDDRSAQATGGLRQLAVTAVPEPETIALMFAGLGAIAFMARRCG